VDADASACLVPPLLLQPLIENAVTHGIARLLEGGLIRVDVTRRNGQLAIVVENPCETDAASARPGGVGLDNVRGRLDAMFGREARVDARVEHGRFFVELRLPATQD